MSHALTPVIMAGGRGTRLWPLSRQLNPKQFLALTGEHSLLQETLRRLDGLAPASPILIANEEHRFLVAEQLRQLGEGNATILLEPEGRNTAPAIALAAELAQRNGEDPLLLVLAADHLIKDTEAFQAAVQRAIPLAEDGRLVTFGIIPTHAETGYGYIQQGKALGDAGFEVARFVEKPDQATAEQYLSAGDYCWNSGMFLFRASAYLQELQRVAPDIVEATSAALAGAESDLTFQRLDAEAFARSPDAPIDTAVMEKTSLGAMVPLDAGWSDIGSWSALWEVRDKDDNQNALQGDVIATGSTGNYIQADHRLVAAVGVSDLVVVETKDAVLVAHKDQVQDVKTIVKTIQEQGRHEHFNHREVYRPWGHYDSIHMDTRYQVKRISVKPGEKLSLQMHHHRAEHWVIVKGTARVTKGDEVFLLTENESTFIPIGEKHSLENPGQMDLELIEVQSGSYLGEDDIVRFEDRYGRS